MATFAYARVSSKDQNIDRQREKFLNMGLAPRDIFIDHASGKDFERPMYLILRNNVLREGDLLLVDTIDRFGRNYSEILNEWKFITKELRADIRVLEMDLLDTTKNKDLLGTLISDLVLQLLSYVAETERDKNKTRQREGIETAKKLGKHLGRPKKMKPSNFSSVYKRWTAGKVTAVEAMKELGLSKSTFYRMIKDTKSKL